MYEHELKSKVEEAVMRVAWNHNESDYPKSAEAFTALWNEGMDTPAFSSIIEVCLERGLPTNYLSDLVIDLLSILRWYPPTSFYWGIYDCGSVWIKSDHRDAPGYIRTARRLHENMMIYFWDQEKQTLTLTDQFMN